MHKLIEAPVADLISKFRGVTASNFKDFDDLPIRVMLGLPRARIVIKERCDSILQVRKIFFRNFPQQGEAFGKTPPPFTDGVLPKAYLRRYLHVIEAICCEQDYLCTLNLASRKCSAFGKSIKDGLNGVGYFYRNCNKWHINSLLFFSLIMPYISYPFHKFIA